MRCGPRTRVNPPKNASLVRGIMREQARWTVALVGHRWPANGSVSMGFGYRPRAVKWHAPEHH